MGAGNDDEVAQDDANIIATRQWKKLEKAVKAIDIKILPQLSSEINIMPIAGVIQNVDTRCVGIRHGTAIKVPAIYGNLTNRQSEISISDNDGIEIFAIDESVKCIPLGGCSCIRFIKNDFTGIPGDVNQVVSGYTVAVHIAGIGV